MNITNTKKKIEKAARFIADSDGFNDYDIIVLLNHPGKRMAIKYNHEEVSMQKICDVVCEYFDIDYEVLFMKNRIQPFCTVRQIIWYISYSVYGLESTRIAALTGYDHTTVLHGVKVIREQMEVNKDISKKVIEILEILTENK